jgi:hypothetical protein
MKDLLLNSDFDLDIQNGDMVLGESDAQNINLLIRLSQGNIKQHPLVGFGEERLLNGVLDGRARRDIQEAILVDGYNLTKFEILPNGTFNIIV